MMYGVWKVISKQTWRDNQEHCFNILINWWNKIYGKQLNENGTNYSNSSGVNWKYLYDERSEGNLRWVSEWVKANNLDRYLTVITSAFL